MTFFNPFPVAQYRASGDIECTVLSEPVVW
nr:MAG TPA: hypothetical protein [Bacteriophage sp.]